MHLFELRESDHQLLEVHSDLIKDHLRGKISHLDQSIDHDEKLRNFKTDINKKHPTSKMVPNLEG